MGIFRGNGNGDPLLLAATGNVWNGFGQVPGITVADTVAFQTSRIAGGEGVYRLNVNGQLDTVVETPDARFKEVPSGRVGLNASGHVVFLGVTKAGPAGIYLWTAPAINPVIETGAALFGSRVTGVGLGVGDLNDRGQVAFQYDLADGRSGIAVATPGNNPVNTPPAFFNGQAALGNGVYYLQFPNGNPFGYYSYLSDPRYFFPWSASTGSDTFAPMLIRLRAGFHLRPDPALPGG